MQRWFSNHLGTGAGEVYRQITGEEMPHGAKAIISSEILRTQPTIPLTENDLAAAKMILDALDQNFYADLSGNTHAVTPSILSEIGLSLLRPE